jgi:hypothetical protein
MASGAVIIDDDGSDKRGLVHLKRVEDGKVEELDTLTKPKHGDRVHLFASTKLVSISVGSGSPIPVSSNVEVIGSSGIDIRVHNGGNSMVISADPQFQKNADESYSAPSGHITAVKVDGNSIDLGVHIGLHLDLEYQNA